MARKRTVLDPAVEAEIARRTARGESAQTIFHAIHGALSVATIIRRQAELRSGGAPARSDRPDGPVTTVAVLPSEVPAPLPAEDVPEAVPEGTPVEMIDRWIERVERGAKAAEEAGNLPALSSLAMRAASLAEARRKAMPLPKPDPADNPDFQALAARGREKLAKLAENILATNNNTDDSRAAAFVRLFAVAVA